MTSKLVLTFLVLSLWCINLRPVYAVDESAADLVARGRLHLGDITDAINQKYKNESGNYWDIANIAYHDFTGVPEVDVIVGIAGYRDKGNIYNNGKQVVEDSGAGFAYFHKDKDNWELKQVELVKGKKYDGFEGANLIGLDKDQLVIYSSEGKEKIATVFMVPMNHVLKKIAEIVGEDFGPRVAQEGNHCLLVDFRRALVNDSGDCQLYYGHAYRWENHRFVPEASDFLEMVHQYSNPKLDPATLEKGLNWFENYLTKHPNDFCTLANCYDLCLKLNLTDQSEAYKKQLLRLGMDSVLNLKYCDEWMSDKNRVFQQQYLDELSGKSSKMEAGSWNENEEEDQ